MDEFYNFLAEHGIDKEKFKVNKLLLKDILILDKDISQKVSQEWVQKREEEWEWLTKNKKEIPYNFQFDKNKTKIWKTIIYWIQPWTYWFDNCKTCDGHWELSCIKCNGSWEMKCNYCNWKSIIIEKKEIYDKKEVICSFCNWSAQITWKCNSCMGKWVKQIKQKCLWCKGFWKIKNPQTNQFQICQSCQGKGWIIQNIKCNNCNGWIVTLKCWKCINWKFTKTITNYVEETKPCNYCKQTWTVLCNTCNWNRSIICQTCSWERKTYQYQLNKFTLEVKQNFKLLENVKFNNFSNLVELFYIIPFSKVKSITVQEKEKLVENNVQIKENNISRINWYIFKFQEKNTLIDYFIFYSKIDNQFYFSKLPPKSTIEATLDLYIDKITSFSKNIYNNYIRKIIDFIYQKKNY